MVVEASATLNAITHQVEEEYRTFRSARLQAGLLFAASTLSLLTAARLYYIVHRAPLRLVWRVREAHRRVPQYTSAYRMLGGTGVLSFLFLVSPFGPLHQITKLAERVEVLDELGVRALVCRQVCVQSLNACEKRRTRSGWLRLPTLSPSSPQCFPIPSWGRLAMSESSSLWTARGGGGGGVLESREAANEGGVGVGVLSPGCGDDVDVTVTPSHPRSVRVEAIATPLLYTGDGCMALTPGPVAETADPASTSIQESKREKEEHPSGFASVLRRTLCWAGKGPLTWRSGSAVTSTATFSPSEWEGFTTALWHRSVQQPLETLGHMLPS